MRNIIFYITFALLSGIFVSCNFRYPFADPETYKDTPAYDLVRKLDHGKWKQANQILSNNPELANYSEPKYGNSVLLWATINENEKAVRLLLDHGANVNKSNNYGDHPLSIYTEKFNKEENDILQLLLEHQAISDTMTQKFRNGALILASSRSLEEVKLLLQFGADPTYRWGQESALSTAITQAKFDVIYYLLFTYKMDPYFGYMLGFDNDTLPTMEFLKMKYDDAVRKKNSNYSKEYFKIINALEEQGYSDK